MPYRSLQRRPAVILSTKRARSSRRPEHIWLHGLRVQAKAERDITEGNGTAVSCKSLEQSRGRSARKKIRVRVLEGEANQGARTSWMLSIPEGATSTPPTSWAKHLWIALDSVVAPLDWAKRDSRPKTTAESRTAK